MFHACQHTLIARCVGVALLSCCVSGWATRAAVAADVIANLAVDDAADASPYVGTLSCSSVSCHGRGEGRRAAGLVARNEFVTWSQFDPHARAASTIHGPKFQDILERLGAVRDGAWNLAVYARCAECHDPQRESLAGSTDSAASPTHLARNDIHPRGIGCESCHGPAQKWLAKHYQRNVTPNDLVALGMVRTKDLATRGGMCVECHVGSPTRDMNHDMIAAGHPALRFELVTYHDQLAKHWDDTGERLATPEFTAQLWATGQLADASATLRLSDARAARAAAKPTAASADPSVEDPLGLAPLWPQFSEYNCLSCHQPLHGSILKNSPLPVRRRLGLPVWNDWHFALTDKLLIQLRGSDTRPPTAPQLSPPALTLRQLRDRMVIAPPLDDRGNLPPLSHDILNAIFSAQSQLQSWDRNRSTVAFTSRQLMQLVRDSAHESEHKPEHKPEQKPEHKSDHLSTSQPRDWEVTCQLFLALRAATRAYRDDLRILAHRGQITREQEVKWLTECETDGLEMAVIQRSLSFNNEHDWPRALDVNATAADQTLQPRVESELAVDLNLEQIAAKIATLAERLELRAARLPEHSDR